jgi:branched-chain amino acid transport system substrate-binding protein
MAGPAMLESAFAAGAGINEIRIGNTIDYTGPVRAAGVVGKVISAYFDKVNAEGGVNGRRIKFISYDDTYNPAKPSN